MTAAIAQPAHDRAREALLETLGVSRGGMMTRAAALVLATTPVVLFLGEPWLFAWLAALIVWDGVLIRALERSWVLPVLDRDLMQARLRRAAMVLIGLSLSQWLPLAAWASTTTFGAVVGTAWMLCAATQVFIYYSRDRLLMVAGLLPVVVCAVAGPLIGFGFSGESAASILFLLFALAAGAAFVGRSDMLIAKAAKESAARNAAEAASRAKTRFFAGVHHQLRTPLNAIIGYSEMLRDAAADDGRAQDVEDLERVLEAARLQLSMMSDLLTFSELQDGRIELEIDDFDAGVLAREAAHAYQKDMALTLELGLGLGGARSDAAKLRHCLDQLLSNAAKYGKGRPVGLAVRREGGELVFVVRDEGDGIDPALLERIFEPLAQVEASSAEITGAGMGLAITLRLARLLGGTLSVESAPGEGSCFTLRVKAVLEPETAAALAA